MGEAALSCGDRVVCLHVPLQDPVSQSEDSGIRQTAVGMEAPKLRLRSQKLHANTVEQQVPQTVGQSQLQLQAPRPRSRRSEPAGSGVADPFLEKAKHKHLLAVMTAMQAPAANQTPSDQRLEAPEPTCQSLHARQHQAAWSSASAAETPSRFHTPRYKRSNDRATHPRQHLSI